MDRETVAGIQSGHRQQGPEAVVGLSSTGRMTAATGEGGGCPNKGPADLAATKAAKAKPVARNAVVTLAV